VAIEIEGGKRPACVAEVIIQLKQNKNAPQSMM
jgi:hypothetical protein